MIKYKIGDIFSGNEKYLVHQTNCLTTIASGIAGIIFKKFPYSDCYFNRVGTDVPGTIKIFGNGQDKRFIVNLMGQFGPGKSNENSTSDKALMRQMYFHEGLIHLSKVNNLESVSFPAGIGCAIAGGDWKVYSAEIEEFHYSVNKIQKVDVSIYCLPENVKQFNFKEN